MRVLHEIRNSMGNYHVKSGIYHYFRSEYQQAEEFLVKALKDEESLSQADRGHARHYLTLSLIDRAAKLSDEGKLEDGLEHLQRAVLINSTFPDIHWRMALLLEDLERFDEAIAEYRQAIDCAPDYLDAHVSLGMCLMRLGRFDEASAAFRLALEVRKRRMDAPFERGLQQLRDGDAAAAEESFHEAFLASPKLSDEHLKKAVEWVRAEEFEKALGEIERAAGVNPKYPDIHNFRGIVLCELDRPEEAVEAFGLSVSLSPKYLVPRLNLAFALVRAGEYRKAEAELEAILEQDPTEQAAAAKLEELQSGRVPDKRRPVTRSNR